MRQMVGASTTKGLLGHTHKLREDSLVSHGVVATGNITIR